MSDLDESKDNMSHPPSGIALDGCRMAPEATILKFYSRTDKIKRGQQ